jgi:hypothetical protein
MKMKNLDNDNKFLYTILIVLGVILLSLSLIIIVKNVPETIYGKVSYANVGCCETICQETSADQCPNNFNAGKSCSEIQQCNMGCCVDIEGYCYENYLQSSCEDKGSFYASSCLDHYPCIMRKEQNSLLRSTGIPILIELDALHFVKPDAGKNGNTFLINAYAFEDDDRDFITVNLSILDYKKEIYLFDDGLHGDGNDRDRLYSASWGEELDIKDLTIAKITQNNQLKSSFFISPTTCLPLMPTYNDNESIKNVIFAGSENYSNVNNFNNKAELILANLVMGSVNTTNITSENPLGIDSKYNFMYLQKSVPAKNSQIITNLINQECNFLKSEPQNNIIIFINDNELYCEQEENLIEVSPQFQINQSFLLENDSQKLLLENFCDYVITEQEMKENIESKYIPPLIMINDYKKGEVNNPNISLEFTVYDNKNESIEYKIYADMDHPLMYLDHGNITNGTQLNLSLAVPDGFHFIYIEAIDNDGNLAISPELQVEKRVNDFVIMVNSLDKISHLNSPDVEFNILHKVEQEINFQLYDDNVTLLEGMTFTGINEKIPTQLSDGEHTLYLTAIDQKNNTINSWPYYIVVGSDEERELYPIDINAPQKERIPEIIWK